MPGRMLIGNRPNRMCRSCWQLSRHCQHLRCQRSSMPVQLNHWRALVLWLCWLWCGVNSWSEEEASFFSKQRLLGPSSWPSCWGSSTGSCQMTKCLGKVSLVYWISSAFGFLWKKSTYCILHTYFFIIGINSDNHFPKFSKSLSEITETNSSKHQQNNQPFGCRISMSWGTWSSSTPSWLQVLAWPKNCHIPSVQPSVKLELVTWMGWWLFHHWNIIHF